MSTENKPEPLVSDVWIDTRHQTYDHRECIVANRAAMAVRSLYETDRQANLKTIADLRAQVERMQKAGNAMCDRLGSEIDYLDIYAKATAMRERDAWMDLTPTTDGK